MGHRLLSKRKGDRLTHRSKVHYVPCTMRIAKIFSIFSHHMLCTEIDSVLVVHSWKEMRVCRGASLERNGLKTMVQLARVVVYRALTLSSKTTISACRASEDHTHLLDKAKRNCGQHFLPRFPSPWTSLCSLAFIFSSHLLIDEIKSQPEASPMKLF